ncbi:MAG: response regulator [Bradymonadaceae bacterium]
MTTVLVVEDNEMNRDLFVRLLRTRDYEILEADNGRDAIEVTRESRPDVVLMDLSMPVMNGWEAALALKEESETADIPIIAVTAHATEGEREKALAHGCDEFISKPFDFDRLAELIESVVS